MEGVQDTDDPECIHETTNQATDPQPTPKITHSSLKMMPQDLSLKALIHVLAYKRCLCGDIEWGAREWGGGGGGGDYARRCVSTTEGHGSFFGLKGVK